MPKLPLPLPFPFGFPSKKIAAKASSSLGLRHFGVFSGHTNQFAEVGYNAGQQFGFDPELSDHLMAHFTEHKLLTWNQMMQARGNNTAFHGFVEDEAAYLERAEKKLVALCQFLSEHTEIAVICLQEAEINGPLEFVRSYINQHFPKEWNLMNPSVTEDSTGWGVFTLINHERLNASKPNLDLSLTRDIKIKDIGIRCRTFDMFSLDNGELIKFTNLHLPHNNTEEALTAFMTNVVKNIIQHGLNAETLTHKLVGDWNIDAEHLNILTQQIINKEMKAAPVGTIFPFHISTEWHASKEGHLKQSGEKLSVDALLEIKVQPAESYSYRFHYFPGNNSSAAAVAMFVSSIFVGAMGFDRPSKQVEGKEQALQDRQEEGRFRP